MKKFYTFVACLAKATRCPTPKRPTLAYERYLDVELWLWNLVALYFVPRGRCWLVVEDVHAYDTGFAAIASFHADLSPQSWFGHSHPYAIRANPPDGNVVIYEARTDGSR